MNSFSSRSTWIVFAATLAAWGGVIFFAWLILGMQDERHQQLGSSEQEAVRQITAVHTHAVAQDTAEERANLDKITKVDVLTAVNTIENAATSIGIALRVRDAQAEPGQNSTDKQSPDTLNVIGLLVEGDGSFPALMRSVQILEQLPFVTSIESLELTSGGPSKEKVIMWHASLRIRLYTSTSIAS